MALEGGAGGSGAHRVVHEPLRRHRRLGSRATADHRRADGDHPHQTDIDLERLTGVRERHVAGEGEDSYTLALGAARDALAHADCAAEDLDMLIVSSISRHVGGLRMQLEPPLSVSLKQALGADAR